MRLELTEKLAASSISAHKLIDLSKWPYSTG